MTRVWRLLRIRTVAPMVFVASFTGCATKVPVVPSPGELLELRESMVAATHVEHQDSEDANSGTGPFSMAATYIGEAAANPRGGMRHDATFVGRVLIAADLTLDAKRRQPAR